MKRTSPQKLRRALVTTALGVGLLFSSGAQALDMQDILNLQAAGLDPGTIVTVIRSSSDPLTVTADEVELLRAAGTAQPILDELCLRVGCGGGAQQMGGGIGVGPDLQREMDLQRQQEEERIRLERERYEAERQRMQETIDAERAREAQRSAVANRPTNADRAYRQGDYLAAALGYRTWLGELNPAPGTQEYAEGLSGYVKAMYSAGYRYTIRREALEAALMGPTNPAFTDVFQILAAISNETGFLDPAFERFTDFQVGTQSAAFQDEWNYFLGRFFREYADYGRATELLSRVNERSARRGQALFLIGQMAIASGENRRAMEAFRGAIVATESNDSDPEVAELANLAIARVAYEVANFDVALYHYRKIPATSPRHPVAVFESAWTYTLKQDWDRAVGTLHALHSPYYDHWFHPELYVIEAYAYLSTCNLDAAQETVDAFNTELQRLQRPVQEFVAADRSPEEYWEAIATYHARYGTREGVALPIEAVRTILSDSKFVNRLNLISSLREEQARLRANSARLGPIADNALATLENDLMLKTMEAGIEIQSRLFTFSEELTDWYVKSQEINIEVRSEILSVFDAALGGVEIDVSTETSVLVLAQDWLYWPFEGEYWIDEVDAYRASLPSYRDEQSGRCISVDVSGPTGNR